jgi:hypothetical protein
MIEHEKKCSSNPIFKNCWSCKFHEPATYDESWYCDIMKLNVYEYEYDGNCPEWKTDNEKLLRKIKINRINQSVNQ